jgi:hypothetical protein
VDRRKVEDGEEKENLSIDQIKPQGMVDDKKGGKAPAAVKDDKK